MTFKEQSTINPKRQFIEITYILIILTTFVACTSTISLFTMVYCCLKRRNSFKSDLASPNKIQEICIIPVQRPKLNESKPQLSIDTKSLKSTKSLIER